MKKRSLSKNRFLIMIKKCKPKMGKGTFVPKQNKCRQLFKKPLVITMHKRRVLFKSATNPL